MSAGHHHFANLRNTSTDMYLDSQISPSLLGRHMKENNCTCSMPNAIVKIGAVADWKQSMAFRNREGCLHGSLSTGHRAAFSNELEFGRFRMLPCQWSRVEYILNANLEFEVDLS